MMRIAAVLYYLGALALFTGLVLRMFMPDLYAYVFRINKGNLLVSFF